MNKLKLFVLGLFLLSSCSSPPNTGSGTIEANQQNNEIFISSNISNLTIKSGKINVNADVSIIKDGKTIATKNSILGEKGQSYGVTGISSGNNGSAIFNTTIIPPSVSGKVTIKVKVHDLNSGTDKIFEKIVNLK